MDDKTKDEFDDDFEERVVKHLSVAKEYSKADYERRLPKIKDLLKELSWRGSPELMVELSKAFIDKLPKLEVHINVSFFDVDWEQSDKYAFELVYPYDDEEVAEAFSAIPGIVYPNIEYMGNSTSDEDDDVALFLEDLFSYSEYRRYTNDRDPFNTISFEVPISSLEDLENLYDVSSQCMVKNADEELVPFETVFEIINNLPIIKFSDDDDEDDWDDEDENDDDES